MAAVVLAPGELTIRHTDIYAGHFFDPVIIGYTQILYAKQFKNSPCGNCSRIASLLVEPFGIALFGDTVAYKC